MITTLIVRVCEILFTAVALGLSIKAVRWQVSGHTPATSSYSAFAGAFGLFVAFIGVVAMWIEKIPGLIMSIIDALASVILLAAGIVSSSICEDIDRLLTYSRRSPSDFEASIAARTIRGPTRLTQPFSTVDATTRKAMTTSAATRVLPNLVAGVA